MPTTVSYCRWAPYVVEASQSGHRPETVSTWKPLQLTVGMFRPAQKSMSFRFLQVDISLCAITRPDLSSLRHSDHPGSIVCRRAESFLFLDVYWPNMEARPDLHSFVAGVGLQLQGKIESFHCRSERHHEGVSD